MAAKLLLKTANQGRLFAGYSEVGSDLIRYKGVQIGPPYFALTRSHYGSFQSLAPPEDAEFVKCLFYLSPNAYPGAGAWLA